MFPYGPPVLTTDTYPDDVDTTALALLKLDVPDVVKHKCMDDILENRNSDGLVYVGKLQPLRSPSSLIPIVSVILTQVVHVSTLSSRPTCFASFTPMVEVVS